MEVLRLEFSDLELIASRNEPIPRGISAIDQATYLSLRNLYSQFSRRSISAEEAARDKRIIKTTHESMKKSMEFERKCGALSVELWRRLEPSANEYAKTKSTESADRMYQIIYGMLPGKREG